MLNAPILVVDIFQHFWIWGCYSHTPASFQINIFEKLIIFNKMWAFEKTEFILLYLCHITFLLYQEWKKTVDWILNFLTKYED